MTTGEPGQHLAAHRGFCNPGAGEIAHRLSAREMAKWFDRAEPMSFSDLRERLLTEYDVLVAAIRVSVGAPSRSQAAGGRARSTAQRMRGRGQSAGSAIASTCSLLRAMSCTSLACACAAPGDKDSR